MVAANEIVKIPEQAIVYKHETVPLENQRFLEVAVYETLVDGPPILEEILYSYDKVGQIEILESIKAVSNRVIATFSMDTNQTEISKVLHSLDLMIERKLGNSNTYLVGIRSGGIDTLDEILGRLNNLSKEILIEFYPDYIGTWEVIPNDPHFGDLWHFRNVGQNMGWPYPNPTPGAHIHAEAAWDIIHDAPSNVVAILDSGTDYNHPDLTGNI